MLWKRLRSDRSGFTLVELTAGLAIAALLLVTVASLEISSMRYRTSDEKAFSAGAEAATLLDRIAQDMRQSMGYTLTADGAGVLTLNVPGGPVTYEYSESAQQVTRQGRVMMREASSLQFYREDGGRTLRAVVTGPEGLRLESRATARIGP